MRAFFKFLNVAFAIFTLIATFLSIVGSVYDPKVNLLGLGELGFAFITLPFTLCLVLLGFGAPNMSPYLKLGIPLIILIFLISLVIIALVRLIKRNKVGLLSALYILDVIVALTLIMRYPTASLTVFVMMRLFFIIINFATKRKYQG